MIRLLGSLTGSALAIALLLLVVGIPQFRAPATEVERTVIHELAHHAGITDERLHELGYD